MTVQPPGVIERAFELAAGPFATVEQIRMQLRKEGYLHVDAHLSGAKIRAELKQLISRRPSLQQGSA